MTDLADYHELVSDLFTLPRTQNEWDRYRLSDEQVEFYRQLHALEGEGQ